MALEPGDKAFTFIYSPNSTFHIQEVEIVRPRPKDFLEVIIKGEAISTADETKHEIGERRKFPDSLIKGPSHVRSVLKQYGKRLIANIFERMF